MKKGIIVLLITVLAAGMVFAGTLTGSAGISFGYDLDSKKWGFENSDSLKYTFKFSVDTASAGVSDHTTNVWAEVAAEGYADIVFDSSDEAFKDGPVYDFDFTITAANIHIGEDITIGILGAGGKYDYAADYHKNSNGSPVNDVVISNKIALTVNETELKAPGFTVNYKEWAGGFGVSGKAAEDDKSYTVLGHAQTKAFTFAEGLTAQAAGLAYLSSANGKVASASAKVAYESDNLSAGLAGDFQYAKEKFVFEVAANAGYDFVTLNVYTTAGKLTADAAKYDDDHTVKLDAKLAAGYTFEGDVPVTVNGSVDATNILVDGREIAVKADASATVKQVKAKVEATYKIMAKSLAPTLTVTYTHDMFKATAKLAMGFAFGAEEALTSLKPELSVESTKLVENATLALSWKNAQFAGSSKKNGAITASATIKF